MVNERHDSDPYWNAALETQTRAEWDSLKLGLLRQHLDHAAASPYWRERLAAAGLSGSTLRSLDDLRRLEPVNKATLRARQQAAPPFGDMLAVPERDVVYIAASSGSTGVPTASPFTAADFDDWMEFEARLFWGSGLRPTDRYCHALNFSLFVGGPCVLGAQRVGALSIHAGTVPSDRLLGILRQFQATAMWTTPSYAWHLGEVADRQGIDLRRDLAVRRIFVAGEPGGSIPETRERIEALWGAELYDYYGLSDVFGACAGMGPTREGLHWAEDHIHAEILDPQTGEPVAEGERGELVVTTLRKRARPLLRFRTGDIVSATTEPARCGRTALRIMGVHGRLDDMVIVKGVNLFPSDVEAIVRQDPALTGEYRLVLDRVNHLDRLTVEVERAIGRNEAEADLAARIGRRLKAVTGISAEIVVLAEGTLPRATHKAKRLEDRRGRVWT
ncbi:MAG: phenylacetate--CoA ligase [Acetobacteraceae bacterium]|nr:phenylacetate--CoA ligase [Acetobacteraceae bacterium]